VQLVLSQRAGCARILRPSALWWALVLLASAGVLRPRLFNTAIEGLADGLHPQDHPGYSHREGLRGRRRAHRGARALAGRARPGPCTCSAAEDDGEHDQLGGAPVPRPVHGADWNREAGV